jgi:hypothetical protein
MRRRPSRIEIIVLVRTLVSVFLLVSIHVRDPPYPLHRPPSIDLSRSPASAAVLRPGPLQVHMRDMLKRGDGGSAAAAAQAVAALLPASAATATVAAAVARCAATATATAADAAPPLPPRCRRC